MRMLFVGVAVLSVVFGVALAADDAPAQRTKAVVQLKRVDAGTLPTPQLGGVVYDVLTGQVLVSDGGTWANACQ